MPMAQMNVRWWHLSALTEEIHEVIIQKCQVWSFACELANDPGQMDYQQLYRENNTMKI